MAGVGDAVLCVFRVNSASGGENAVVIRREYIPGDQGVIAPGKYSTTSSQ